MTSAAVADAPNGGDRAPPHASNSVDVLSSDGTRHCLQILQRSDERQELNLILNQPERVDGGPRKARHPVLKGATSRSDHPGLADSRYCPSSRYCQTAASHPLQSTLFRIDSPER